MLDDALANPTYGFRYVLLKKWVVSRICAMDQLTTVLSHFSLHAGVFYTGNICGIHDFQQDPLRGHLHLIRRGSVQVTGVQQEVLNITEPTLLFLPRPQTHSLRAESHSGSDVVCGTVRFGGGGNNPITDSLPGVVLVKLAALPGVEALMGLMFDEAFPSSPAVRQYWTACAKC